MREESTSWLLGAVLCLAVSAAHSAPVGTAFTYQGHLSGESVSVDGPADLVFTLWDAAEGGSMVGGPIQLDEVNVESGLFHVTLDFGDDAFVGEERWLQVAVRQDEDPFSILSPRQLLSSTPQASFALESAQWRTSINDSIVNSNGGFVGINRDWTVTTSEVFGVHSPAQTSLEYGGMYVSTEGADALPFYGYSAGGKLAWHNLDGLTGNWQLYVNGFRITVRENGAVGIGTTAPTERLHVASAGFQKAIYAMSDLPTGVGIQGETTSTTGSNIGVAGVARGSSGVGVYAWAPSATGSTIALRATANSPDGFAGYFEGARSYFDSFVGIGTFSPTHRLHVLSSGSSVLGQTSGANTVGVRGVATGTSGLNVGVLGTSQSTSGTAVQGHAMAQTGTTYGVRGAVESAAGYAGYFTGGRNYFQGNVGIGTLTPPNSLSVAGTADFSGPVSVGVGSADARLLVRGVLGEDAFRVRVEGGTKLLVKDNGGLGIGSNFGTLPENGLRTFGAAGIGADPGAFLFAVNGSAAKPGGGSWSVFSDERLKENIKPIGTGMLDRLLSLHGYSFEYLEEAVEDRFGLPGRQIGLLAQEVQEVFPEWVGQDDEGYLHVTERGTTALFVEALRDLRAEKDAEIQTLREENLKLLQRLESLESRLELAITNRP